MRSGARPREPVPLGRGRHRLWAERTLYPPHFAEATDNGQGGAQLLVRVRMLRSFPPKPYTRPIHLGALDH